MSRGWVFLYLRECSSSHTKGEKGNIVFVDCFVDCLVYKKLLGTLPAMEALRESLKEKKTTLAKILDMSVRLKVEHRIITYIEALA